MKKLVCATMAAVLLLTLVACGSSSDPALYSAPAAGNTADPLAIAEEEFYSAIQSLTEARTSLQELIPEAEELLGTLTVNDVDDPSVWENLRDIKLLATGTLLEPIPEMKSDAEEIRRQVQDISEQTNMIWGILSDLDYAIVQVTESHQRWVESNHSEIIMASATLDRTSKITIYAVNPETGEKRTISEFSLPISVSSSGGLTWYTEPQIFSLIYNSNLPLRRLFSTDYQYIAYTLYSAETKEYRAGFYKEGEGVHITDVTKLVGAVGGDFDAPTKQQALGFTDSNQFIFVDMNSFGEYSIASGGLTTNIEDWIVFQVKVSDTGNIGSAQAYNDAATLLMAGDSWGWIEENWEVTDKIDDTHYLINYPEESDELIFGGSKIYRWGVRIFDVETHELSSFIPGESRTNWSGVASPDGESVAFISAPTSGAKTAALYITSVDGGEPVKILDISSSQGVLKMPAFGASGTAYFLLEWRKAA